MTFKNTTTTYGRVAKLLHWSIFIIVLFMLIYGYCLDAIPKVYHPITNNIHKLIGLCVLLLMLLRILWTLSNIKPLPVPGSRLWEHLAERSVHLLLYVTLIAMPLAGWIATSAANKPPHLGSLIFKLPVPHDKVLAKNAMGVHELLAIFLIILISIHIIAALYHHFIKKDGILKRMM